MINGKKSPTYGKINEKNNFKNTLLLLPKPWIFGIIWVNDYNPLQKNAVVSHIRSPMITTIIRMIHYRKNITSIGRLPT